MKKKIILKRVFHRDKWHILFASEYDESLVPLIRKINGNRYSITYKNWYADDNEETLKQILLLFRDKADIDISALTKTTETDATGPIEVKTEILPPDQQVVLTTLKPENEETEIEVLP